MLQVQAHHDFIAMRFRQNGCSRNRAEYRITLDDACMSNTCVSIETIAIDQQ